MRSVVALVVVVLCSAAEPSFAKPNSGRGPSMTRDEVMDMPFESSPRRPRRTCYGPAAWGEILKCIRTLEPTTKVGPKPTAHTQMLLAEGAQQRLYAQQPDGKWMLVRTLDASTHVVGEKPVTGARASAYRIELRQQAQYSSGLLRVKDALVCGVGENGGCSNVTYACVWMEHGRTKSVLLGDIVATNTNVEVVADRSRAAPSCVR